MPQTARAMHCTRYGPPEVLSLREVVTPEPRPGEVLLRVHAATVTLGDCEVRAFKMVSWAWLPVRLAIGVTRPRQPVLGMEVAGEVVATGEGVDRFQIGDAVFGSTGLRMGAYADFVAVSQSAALTHIPPGLTFAQTAGLPTGGLNGLHFVRVTAPKAGEKVLIIGAGGSIGMFATQLASALGASITAVDKAGKHAMLLGLGAEQVIDYETTDFWTSGERYDVIIDVVGASPFGATVKCLRDGGRYMLGNPHTLQVLGAIAENLKGRVLVLFSLAGLSVDDLDDLAHKVSAQELRVVIDRTFPLDQMVAAHSYVETGRKAGIVVIDVSGKAHVRAEEVGRIHGVALISGDQ